MCFKIFFNPFFYLSFHFRLELTNIMMEAVNLSAATDAAVEFDEELCIICQEYTQDKLVCTQHGCDQIISASETRQDAVLARLKKLTPGALFNYHVTNACYKGYLHK